jgi:uncharacterized protein (TIGR02001 family)
MNHEKLSSLFSLILLTLLIFTTTTTSVFAADQAGSSLSGNLSAVSTYVWRGLPAADAALQGGIDYSTAQGIHAGAWTSNVYGGSELDLTAGYSGTFKDIGFNVGLTVYQFPQYEATLPGDYNFNELYAGITKDFLNVRFSSSADAGNYLEANVNFEKLVANWDLGLHFGSYSVDKGFAGLPGKDYNDYNVSLGSVINGLGVKITLSDTNLTKDSYRTIISVSKSFTP